VLFEVSESGVERFRCSVGHVYSIDSLDGEQERALESALWEAVRALEDRAIMLRRLSAMAGERNQRHVATGFARRADDLFERSRTIRRVVEQPGPNDQVAASENGQSQGEQIDGQQVSQGQKG
jgi:two-component system chemotaxis response regulator CheB